MRNPLLLFEDQLFGEVLAGFERTRGGQRHLPAIRGNLPPIRLSHLIVSAVDRIHGMRIDKLKGHGIVAGVLQIVLLSVKAGGVAELTRKTDPAVSVRLDPEPQPLPQTSLAEVLRPFAAEWIAGDLCASASGPHGGLIGMSLARSRDRELVPITGKFVANRRHDSSVLLFLDLDLLLTDPAQLNLVERRIAGYRRAVSVRLGGEIEVGLAGHDYMHCAM